VLYKPKEKRNNNDNDIFINQYLCTDLGRNKPLVQGGVDKCLAWPEKKNKLQRPNSGFIQHTPHKTQYTS
jgi:hypothetical protein